MDFRQRLADGAAALNLPLDAPALDRLVTYRDRLRQGNQIADLVADTSDAVVLTKHLLDSLLFLQVMRQAVDAEPSGRLVDIGTGAGLPGLVLAIAAPSLAPALDVVLLDSLRKRTDFLTIVVRALELDRVTVLTGRAETVAREAEHRAGYDWAVARRVAELPVLLEYALPLLRVGGRAVLAKGEAVADEVAAAGQAVALLGGDAPRLLELPLPKAVVPPEGPAVRRFVTVAKVAPTPETYPRRDGMPKKRPLGRRG